MPLTGRFGFRKSLMGKIILQVEEERPVSWPFSRGGKYRARWRDARFLDMVHPELRGLISFRDYVQECPHANFATPFFGRERKRVDRLAMQPELEPAPAPQRQNGSGAVRPNGSGARAEGFAP